MPNIERPVPNASMQVIAMSRIAETDPPELAAKLETLMADVRTPGHRFQAAPPALHALGVAVDRGPAVVDQKHCIGKIGGKSGNVLGLVRVHQELERQVITAQQSHAVTKRRRIDQPRFGPALRGIGMPANGLAQAHHALARGLPFQHRLDTRVLQRGEGNIAGRDSP